jgi:hypothetical protein
MMTNPYVPRKKPWYESWCPPSNPQQGDVWCNTDDGLAYHYIGSNWYTSSTGPLGPGLKMFTPKVSAKTMTWDNAEAISGNVDDGKDAVALQLAGLSLLAGPPGAQGAMGPQGEPGESHGKEILEVLKGMAASLRLITMRGIIVRTFTEDAANQLNELKPFSWPKGAGPR